MSGTLGELKAIFSGDATKLEKVLSTVDNKFGQTFKKIEAGANNVPSAFNKLNAGILGIQAAMGGLAGAAVVSLGTHLVSEFAQAERQSRVLEAALNATGRSQAFDPLIANATQLQRQLSIDGDALTEATGRLASFNKSLNSNELKKSQTAIVALASALHTDLSSAAFMVEKTLGGTMNMLGRYGIQIDLTKDAHGRLNQILEKTSTMLEVAKEQANTTEGRIAGLNQAWGDMQEVMGQVIAQGLDLNGSLKNTTDTLNNSTDAVNDNREAWVRHIQFWKAVVSTLLNGAGLVGTAFAGVVTSTTASISEAINLVAIGINNMIRFTTDKLNSLINWANPIVNKLTFGGSLPNLMTPQLPTRQFGQADPFSNQASQWAWSTAGWFGNNIKNDWGALGRPIPTLPRPRSLNIPTGGEGGAGNSKGSKAKQAADKAAKDLLALEKELSNLYEKSLGPIQKYNHEIDKLNQLREKAIKSGKFKAYGGQALFDQETKRLGEEIFGSINVLEKITPTKPSQDAAEAIGRMLKPSKQWLEDFQDELDKTQTEVDKLMEGNDKLIDKWNEAQQVVESIKTPLQQHNDELQRYAELLDMGYLNQEQWSAAVQESNKAFEDLTLQGNYHFQQLNGVMTRFGQSVEDTFVDMFQTGSFNFSKLANSVISDVIRMGLQMALLEPLFGSGQNGQRTGILTKFMRGAFLSPQLKQPAGLDLSDIKGFAGGGDPPVGIASLVGEEGPELFVPRSPGTILTAKATRMALAGGGGSVNVNHYFTIQAIDAMGMDAQLKAREGWFRRIAVESVQAAYNKRGQYGPMDRR